MKRGPTGSTPPSPPSPRATTPTRSTSDRGDTPSNNTNNVLVSPNSSEPTLRSLSFLSGCVHVCFDTQWVLCQGVVTKDDIIFTPVVHLLEADLVIGTGTEKDYSPPKRNSDETEDHNPLLELQQQHHKLVKAIQQQDQQPTSPFVPITEISSHARQISMPLSRVCEMKLLQAHHYFDRYCVELICEAVPDPNNNSTSSNDQAAAITADTGIDALGRLRSLLSGPLSPQHHSVSTTGCPGGSEWEVVTFKCVDEASLHSWVNYIEEVQDPVEPLERLPTLHLTPDLALLPDRRMATRVFGQDRKKGTQKNGTGLSPFQSVMQPQTRKTEVCDTTTLLVLAPIISVTPNQEEDHSQQGLAGAALLPRPQQDSPAGVSPLVPSLANTPFKASSRSSLQGAASNGSSSIFSNSGPLNAFAAASSSASSYFSESHVSSPSSGNLQRVSPPPTTPWWENT